VKLETRSIRISETETDSHIILIAESEIESHSIDLILGDCGKGPIGVCGEVTLADGYAEHYIRLRPIRVPERKISDAKANAGRSKRAKTQRVRK
jgi:hypothetical protein